MAVKVNPPIVTRDFVEVKVGNTLYCIDTCSYEKKIEKLEVLSIDLAANRRSLRLRRSNSREWTWTAMDKQNTCSNQNHEIYASRAACVARKKETTLEAAAHQAMRDLNQTKEELLQVKKSIGWSMSSIRKDRGRIKALKIKEKKQRTIATEKKKKVADAKAGK